MHVSGKPFIAPGIASPLPKQGTRNEHVSMHTFNVRGENSLLTDCQQLWPRTTKARFISHVGLFQLINSPLCQSRMMEFKSEVIFSLRLC